MFVIPEAIAHSIILFQRYKPKTLKIFFVPNNLNSRIQSPLRHMRIWRSRLKKRIKNRGPKNISKNALGTEKEILLALKLLSLRLQKKRKSSSNTSIVTQRAIISMIASTFQKTSVNLNNLCAND